MDALKVSATLNKRNYVDESDMFLMQYMLWNEPDERPKAVQETFKVLFGSKVSINNKIENLRNTEDDINKIMKLKCKPYLTYRARPDGKTKNDDFDAAKEHINLCHSDFVNMLGDVLAMQEKYKYTLDVESKISKNFLLLQQKNKTYNEEIVGYIGRTISIVNANIKDIEKWWDVNNDIFEYEANIQELQSVVA